MPRSEVVEVHDDPETRHPIFDLSRVGKTTLLKRLVQAAAEGSTATGTSPRKRRANQS